MIIQLPLSSDAAQSFQIQLGASKYQFDVQWNDRANCWTMDITNVASSTVLALGLPLVLGQSLLQPYNLGIGGLLMVDETNTYTEASFDSLGTTTNLYWISTDEGVPV